MANIALIIAGGSGNRMKQDIPNLRHTFAKNFLDRDGKLYDLQNLMGHSSIKTTQKYMKFKKEEIAQKMSVMDGFFDSLPSAPSNP